MKFVENQPSDDTLDLVCRMCPLHLLEPGEKLNCLKKGQVSDVSSLIPGPLIWPFGAEVFIYRLYLWPLQTANPVESR
jgi:hypothetical protein